MKERHESIIDAMADMRSTEAPQHVRNIKWLWESTQRHRYALTRPPVLIAYALLALAAYSLGRFDNAALTAVKNERIAFQADQLAAYKERLNGATPDQAAKIVTVLQERLDEAEQLIRPTVFRKLSDAEQAKLRARQSDLQQFAQPLWIFAGTLGDSYEYAQDFFRFFKSIKVETVESVVSTRCGRGQEGIMVGMKDPNRPSDRARIFVDVLAAAGLAPTTTRWEGAPDGDKDLDFNLFICQPAPRSR